MSYAVYVYADADRNQEKISAKELNWTGTWSSSGSYFADTLDTVLYGDDRFIAIINNVGVNPLQRLPNKRLNPFAELVILQSGDEPPFSPPIGPPPTQDVLGSALTAAWAGTEAAENAINLANHALVTAWTGTTTASQALLSSYAGTAAIALANSAIVKTWSGTNGINSALALAATGTNEASAAIGLANHATELAWIGTNTVVVGYSALQAAWNGTAAAVAAIGLANSALDTAWAGTALIVNGTIALDQTARDLAYLALQTAWTGTGEGAAAIRLANQALQNSWAGTLAVPLAGGTMTGNLRVPQIFVGVGTVPAASNVSGTLSYDMIGPGFQQTIVDRPIVVSAKNMESGAEICALLVSTGQPQPVLYDSNFAWFGTQIPYTSSVLNEKILVPLASTGTAASTVIGATVAQL